MPQLGIRGGGGRGVDSAWIYISSQHGSNRRAAFTGGDTANLRHRGWGVWQSEGISPVGFSVAVRTLGEILPNPE